ncbi:putative hemerythrin-like protein C869,06c [Talaromyces islandicus]|uniref:Putative hemerythrin-like protein C869,06c n=1 Tax=Talaromyces islandicus TaxID=28573 RepID=A0A0U1M7P3_TALIS|nr:putative hemerythrin-like protein C869,06c [Talaromyces islandicus]
MSQRISDVIKQDHKEIIACYHRTVDANYYDEIIRFQNLFIWELARNVAAEELVLYPAIEKAVRGGVVVAEKDRQAHQRIKEQLKTFQHTHPSNPQFIPIIKALMVDVCRYIDDEETNDLMKLEESLNGKDNNSLAKSFVRTKALVPSRSHPKSPRRPPLETVFSLVTAPIDQMADMFRRWPHRDQTVK